MLGIEVLEMDIGSVLWEWAWLPLGSHPKAQLEDMASITLSTETLIVVLGGVNQNPINSLTCPGKVTFSWKPVD